MPLKSNLLKDDARLQKCLISDPDHVTPGSVGEYVSKIQQALFLTNNAAIDGTELGDTRYGPSTAQAVLDFKGPPRNILGPGQAKPDNIVGKRTIAALDEEMFAIEHPVTVQRVSCPGSQANAVKLTNEFTTPAGIGHPKNTGECRIFIDAFDSVDLDPRRKPLKSLELNPGDRSDWFVPPPGAKSIWVVCVQDCQGRGELTYDTPMA